MLLVTLRFTHYAPKDSETGIAEHLLTDTIERAVAYIDEKHMYGYLADAEADNDEGSYAPEFGWLTTPRRVEAEAAGLTIDEYGYVSGPAAKLTRWLCGTFWQGTEESYYGVTHYDWRESREASEADAAVLLRLGIARDIREATAGE